jgi:protein associated with RNAse G/E
MKVKIRGIYATALTKLLYDHDHDIVQPSEMIAQRLGLEGLEEEPDLSIHNRYDLQGVVAKGSTDDIDALSTILQKKLFDVVISKKPEASSLNIEFPWNSKNQLDMIRGTLLPTVPKHHYYKACRGAISSAVDMAERLLIQGRAPQEVETQLMQTIEPYLPYEGSEISVEHVKLSGPTLNLGKAVIESYNDSSIMYVRDMKSNGIYDGLEIEKKAGDYAYTMIKPGKYYTETRYYSKSGRFKGAYINLNTPVEFYPTKIRYVDLEVHRCVFPDGQIRILDMELLERAANQSKITRKLFEIVCEKVLKLETSVKESIPY